MQLSTNTYTSYIDTFLSSYDAFHLHQYHHYHYYYYYYRPHLHHLHDIALTTHATTKQVDNDDGMPLCLRRCMWRLCSLNTGLRNA